MKLMNRKSALFGIFLLISVVFFSFSCRKPEQFSPIPQITFTKIELRDTVERIGQSGNTVKMCKLFFELIDGDGDIGLTKNEIYKIEPNGDTTFLFNFFAKLYEKKNGELVEPDLKAPINFRIPYIEPQGQNKQLKATLSVDFTYNYTDRNQSQTLDSLPYDSIRYEFFLIDRKGNLSNTEATPIFPLDSVGTIFKNR